MLYLVMFWILFKLEAPIWCYIIVGFMASICWLEWIVKMIIKFKDRHKPYIESKYWW